MLNAAPPSSPPTHAYFALALSMALVGSYVALSKPLVAVFPLFLLAWLRFGVGAIAMARWLRKPKTEAPLAPRTRVLLFGQSFFGNFLFSIFMLAGVQRTSASTAGVIMAALPAVVAVLSAWLLRERLSVRALTAIALAVVGIGAYAQLSRRGGQSNMMGNVLVFAAVCCEATYVVIGKKLSAHLSPKRVSALINLWGLALMTPLGLWAALSFSWTEVSYPMWGLLVFYGMAASVWTVWLWMQGLRHVDAHRAGVFTVMLPISAALVGILFLGEHMDAAQMAAFAAALIGVALITTSGPGHFTK
jgi:drug/metabolite transporter (DMT)-like permease